MQPRSIATQNRTGGNNPNLMINLRSSPDAVNAVTEKILHEAARPIPVPISSRRENISQFLVKQGVPVEYTSDNYIHSSIAKHYPTVVFR